MSFRCPYCGDEVGDSGDGLVAHLRVNDDCREPYERQSGGTAAPEWARR